MAASDVSDGPVLNLINKRLRALRKKLNRITQMEEAISQGKPINKEQEETLRSKPAVTVLIDELEKLRQPLSAAVDEEVSLAVQRHQVSVPASRSEPTTISDNDDDGPSSDKPEKPNGSSSSSEPIISRSEPDEAAAVEVVEDLLNLLYFGSLFDVKSQSDFTSTMLTRTHERGCCLTYDYVTDDATDLLGERDLDLISKLGGLLISRPVDSSLTHKNALQRCLEHAKLWLAKSDQLIEPNANITCKDYDFCSFDAGLRERLNKIMASDYLTTTPEMKAPVEVAAAAGNYTPFQVPVHGSISSIQVEGSVSHESHLQQDEGTTDFQGHEMGDNQSSHVEELHKDDEPEMENPEEASIEQEQNIRDTEVEYSQRDVESKEQQYVPRRLFQNQRGGRGGGGGGGRRGYPSSRGARGSSRGAGPYQNGRNQYYDQAGGYYPRNYYNNRGRGGRGGGPSYNNHGSVVQGDQASTSVGVGS
ncbi:glycine-rich protein [Parasponia andersonii]|uniref:Glycine-rich protein n=1 Tax=Parasponia andersonii TaxID=3476 RepID=A0A2P5D2G2_PARAD|nr:glycine-rich protein [Parasponia andersonii]